MYKNIVATLHIIERVRRDSRPVADARPVKLGVLQKIVAFGPLTPAVTQRPR